MPTNLYAIPKPSEAEKRLMKQYLERNQLFDIQEVLPKQMHIGHFVGSRHFTFNHNDWEYYSTPSEMFEFLKNCVLQDDNNKYVSYDEFINEINKITPITEADLKPIYIDFGFIKDGYYFSNSTNFT